MPSRTFISHTALPSVLYIDSTSCLYRCYFLAEEKEKVHYLSQKLDVEAKRRLCSLESAVQSGKYCEDFHLLVSLLASSYICRQLWMPVHIFMQ